MGDVTTKSEDEIRLLGKSTAEKEDEKRAQVQR